MNNTLKVANAEFATAATIDTFVTLFKNQDGSVSLSISLSGSGAPFASTQKLPAGLRKEWFEQKKDHDGNVVPGQLQSRYPLMVSYNGLKRGTKNPNRLFVNVTSVGERPMMDNAEASAFFDSFGETPATQTAEQANAAGQAEQNDADSPF